MEFQFKHNWAEAIMWGLWWFAMIPATILFILWLIGVM